MRAGTLGTYITFTAKEHEVLRRAFQTTLRDDGRQRFSSVEQLIELLVYKALEGRDDANLVKIPHDLQPNQADVFKSSDPDSPLLPEEKPANIDIEDAPKETVDDPDGPIEEVLTTHFLQLRAETRSKVLSLAKKHGVTRRQIVRSLLTKVFTKNEQ